MCLCCGVSISIFWVFAYFVISVSLLHCALDFHDVYGVFRDRIVLSCSVICGWFWLWSMGSAHWFVCVFLYVGWVFGGVSLWCSVFGLDLFVSFIGQRFVSVHSFVLFRFWFASSFVSTFCSPSLFLVVVRAVVRPGVRYLLVGGMFVVCSSLRVNPAVTWLTVLPPAVY